jgi:UDP-glucuronate 4-epimerase
MKYLVTGAAGFIGMYVTKALLEQGLTVVGLDNLNSYYTPALKQYRLEQLTPYSNFRFIKQDIANRDAMAALFKQEQFQRVIHLAAQAGVRHSLKAPFDYADSNLTGMLTILEGCRHNKVQHLVYASSSSVYGMNSKIPFSEADPTDQPISLYAATKKANELMAHSYAHLYQIPTTGLRFFTVYGPAGRPDMAPWLFTEAVLNNQPIKLFNHGKMQRDFTYIDDIVAGIIHIQNQPPQGDICHKIFNIGNSQPVELTRFVKAIETATGKKAHTILTPMQSGDVECTFADMTLLEQATGYRPQVEIEEGMARFVEWYRGWTVNG